MLMRTVDDTGATSARPGGPERGLLDVLHTYRRHLPLFLLVLGLIFGAMALYTLTRTPKYSATASLLISPHKAEVGADKGSTNDPTTDATVDTQVEVLKSRGLAETVVDRLHLEREADFAPVAHPGKLVMTPQIRRTLAVDRVQLGLGVKRVAQTYLLQVSFADRSRRRAAAVANAYVDAFVRNSLDVKLAASGSTNRLLDNQLQSLRGNVETAEAAVGRYKSAHDLLSVQGHTLAEQEIPALDQEVATARAAQAESEARLGTARRQLARGSDGGDVGEALTSPVIQELRRQRAEVSRKGAELEGRYGPRYPARLDAEHQLADTDQQIKTEVGRLVSNLEAQNEVAAHRTASLTGSLGLVRGELSSGEAASVKLNELQRQADAARTLYESVLTRAGETGAQQATTEADARVSSYATLPAVSSSPNVPINLLVGLLLGLGAGVAAVVVRQGLQTGLGTLEDVEQQLGVPYLGGLPTTGSSLRRLKGSTPADAVVEQPLSPFTEAYRGLSAALLRGDGRAVRTIAVTSSLPGEGKTTTAVCFARVLALAGRRVVLVDCDLRRPRIAKVMGIEGERGWTDVVAGALPLDKALVADPKTPAKVLPLGRRGGQSSLESKALYDLLDQLGRDFDVVVLDAPPVLPIVDTRLLAQKVDATVLLVRWRRTPLKAVEMSLHLLRGLGVEVTGVALTRVDLRAQASSGYGDPAHYFKEYREYMTA